MSMDYILVISVFFETSGDSNVDIDYEEDFQFAEKIGL